MPACSNVNFDDDRYLPFEGTGAVSGWVLSFPRYEASDSQKAMLAALTDVIVHVRYTALDGGAAFTGCCRADPGWQRPVMRCRPPPHGTILP